MQIQSVLSVRVGGGKGPANLFLVINVHYGPP